MKRVISAAALLGLLSLLLATPAPAQIPPQNEAKTLDELLDLVRKRALEDRREYQQREGEFAKDRNRQAELLKQAEAKRDALEKRSAELEKLFEENEQTIATKHETLNERLGSLKELFGVFQQVAGDAQGLFHASVTSAQFPGRGEFLEAFAKKMGRTSGITSIAEIEKLWFELQREMTESGKVVKLKTEVTLPDGDTAEREVVRVGVFNAVSDGEYLHWAPETQKLIVLQEQPAGRYGSMAADLQAASEGFADFGLDPSRGSILALLIQTPGLWERIRQGGLIGYVTIFLGVIGLLLSLERIVRLTQTGRKVEAQAASRTIRDDNPLGRVLRVYEDNPKADPETLERKLDEAILRETPPLTRFLAFIRIIAVVAPLLGLLGTVTGMINTFQAITLFGTGDPKLMAGGISQALVTTVIGLCVAIPVVLLHSTVASRSRRITHILEEQAAGIVATRTEEVKAA